MFQLSGVHYKEFTVWPSILGFAGLGVQRGSAQGFNWNKVPFLRVPLKGSIRATIRGIMRI